MAEHHPCPSSQVSPSPRRARARARTLAIAVVAAAAACVPLAPALAAIVPAQAIEWARYDAAFVAVCIGLVAAGGLVALFRNELARLGGAMPGEAASEGVRAVG